MTVEELLEIEQIRALRDAYSACLDGRDAAALAELFCADAVCEFPDRLGGDRIGRDAILGEFTTLVAALGEPSGAVHVVTNPWITLTGPDTARGSCYLIDLRGSEPAAAQSPVLLIGRYEDEYRKVDGRWRFARIRMPMLWSDAT